MCSIVMSSWSSELRLLPEARLIAGTSKEGIEQLPAFIEVFKCHLERFFMRFQERVKFHSGLKTQKPLSLVAG